LPIASSNDSDEVHLHNALSSLQNLLCNLGLAFQVRRTGDREELKSTFH
jgi:hypothetical protein